MLLDDLIGEGVTVGLRRERAVERAVGDDHVLHIREQFVAGDDGGNRGRCVERVDGSDLVEVIQFREPDHIDGQFLTAMDDPMPDGADLGEVCDNAPGGVGQEFHHDRECDGVIGQIRLEHVLVHTGLSVRHKTLAARDIDVFTAAAAKHVARIHVEKLILERRTTCVDHEDFHVIDSLRFI